MDEEERYPEWIPIQDIDELEFAIALERFIDKLIAELDARIRSVWKV